MLTRSELPLKFKFTLQPVWKETVNKIQDGDVKVIPSREEVENTVDTRLNILNLLWSCRWIPKTNMVLASHWDSILKGETQKKKMGNLRISTKSWFFSANTSYKPTTTSLFSCELLFSSSIVFMFTILVTELTITIFKKQSFIFKQFCISVNVEFDKLNENQAFAVVSDFKSRKN